MEPELDAKFMALALAQARLAAAGGEVPVGAVVVHRGAVIAAAHNRTRTDQDPTAHAEVLALRHAAQHLGNFRLEDCTLYVTLEPCTMCVGAVLLARLQRVVFGASEPRTGAMGSVLNVLQIPAVNHQTSAHGGILAAECAAVLQTFFATRRDDQQQQRRDDPQRWPVPEFALRTPEARFDVARFSDSVLGELTIQSRYLNHLPSLQGLRLHYLEAGPQNALQTVVLQHSLGGSSAQFVALMVALAAAGFRVLAPDLIGFGRSDKPKKAQWHTLAQHLGVIQQWAAHVDLHNAVWWSPDWGQRWAAGWARAWSEALPGRLSALVIQAMGQTLPDLRPLSGDLSDVTQRSQQLTAVHTAPFPDAGFQAALRAPALQWSEAEALADLTQQWNSLPAQALQLIDAAGTAVSGEAAVAQVQQWLKPVPANKAPRTLPQRSQKRPPEGVWQPPLVVPEAAEFLRPIMASISQSGTIHL